MSIWKKSQNLDILSYLEILVRRTRKNKAYGP